MYNLWASFFFYLPISIEGGEMEKMRHWLVYHDMDETHQGIWALVLEPVGLGGRYMFAPSIMIAMIPCWRVLTFAYSLALVLH